MTAGPDVSSHRVAPGTTRLEPGRWRASPTARRVVRPALALSAEGAVLSAAPAAVAHQRPAEAALRSVWVRLAIGLGAVAIAYHPSVVATADGIGRGEGRFALVAIPVALALAIARARSARREPDIHDRQLDYLVGLPLLAGAWFVLVVMPQRVPDRYWELRLDVVSFPFFVAGLVAILFGVRALWRWRASVALLVACWPPLYDLIPITWLRGEAGFAPLAVEQMSPDAGATGQALTGAALLCVVGLVAVTVALTFRPRLRHALAWLLFIGVVTLVLDAARALVVSGIDGLGADAPLTLVRRLLPAAVLGLCLAIVFATRRVLSTRRTLPASNRRPERRGAGPLVPAAVWSLALALACVLAPAPDATPAVGATDATDVTPETVRCCP